MMKIRISGNSVPASISHLNCSVSFMEKDSKTHEGSERAHAGKTCSKVIIVNVLEHVALLLHYRFALDLLSFFHSCLSDKCLVHDQPHFRRFRDGGTDRVRDPILRRVAYP